MSGTTVRKFRSGTYVVVGLVISLVLAACSGSSGSSGSVTLDFWDDSATPATSQIYEEVIDEFENENPDITVNYLALPSGESQQKYDAAIAQGETPDIGSMTSAKLSSYIARDALEPLDSRFEESGLEESIQDYLVSGARAADKGEGLYMLPFRGGMEVVWYRKDMFDAASISPPTTWDEFFNAAEVLTDISNGQYGYTIRGGVGGVPQMMAEALAATEATEFYTEDGSAAFTDPAAVEIVERMASIYNVYTPQGDVTADHGALTTNFVGGDIAMMHLNLFAAGTLQEAFGDDLGVLPLPKPDPDGGRTQLLRPVPGYVMFNGSENKDAAWQFMQFLVSHDVNSRLTEEIGSVPANVEAANDPWVSDNSAVSLSLDILGDPDTRTVTAPTYLPGYASIEADAEAEYQRVLLGELSAEQFLNQLSDEFENADSEMD